MHLLVVGYLNGDVEYYGPFQTDDRAKIYAKAVEESLNPQRWHVVPLTVPYSVVKKVEWC